MIKIIFEKSQNPVIQNVKFYEVFFLQFLCDNYQRVILVILKSSWKIVINFYGRRV